ncbi:hypothetical protein DFH07DRAFT_219460 [Mycena maculata]|uniref:DUF6533 domain-containing protein n=1 Tax=Mycena maculata TaxID=230809 RepID=A0AAD7HUZ6_9AGAR|nr:hypothetical protein DFH07DRAFT_219460 [Mycena maculata]
MRTLQDANIQEMDHCQLVLDHHGDLRHWTCDPCLASLYSSMSALGVFDSHVSYISQMRRPAGCTTASGSALLLPSPPSLSHSEARCPRYLASLPITWANRALIAAAVVYLYDSVITFASEIELYRYSKQRVLHLIFISTRYLSLLYQLFVICGIAWSRFTPQVTAGFWIMSC